MKDKTVCEICLDGKITKIKEIDKGAPFFYYLCDSCGSEYADAELSAINKQEAQKYRKENGIKFWRVVRIG